MNKNDFLKEMQDRHEKMVERLKNIPDAAYEMARHVSYYFSHLGNINLYAENKIDSFESLERFQDSLREKFGGWKICNYYMNNSNELSVDYLINTRESNFIMTVTAEDGLNNEFLKHISKGKCKIVEIKKPAELMVTCQLG